MFGFGKKKESNAQAKAVMFFEKYTQKQNHSFSNKSIRLIIIHALRKHIEKVLFAGIETGQEFKEKKLLAVLHPDLEEPEKPTFDTPYQIISTKAGPVISYLPAELSSEIFNFGLAFADSKIDVLHVKESLQAIMDDLARSLGISVEMKILADTELENIQ